MFHIEDLNLSHPSSHEFLRHHLTYKEWSDSESLKAKRVTGVQYLATINPARSLSFSPSSSSSSSPSLSSASTPYGVDGRLVGRFLVTGIPDTPEEELFSIFHHRLCTSVLSKVENNSSLLEIAPRLVQCLLELHTRVVRSFPHRPRSPTYSFSLRDISSVLNGIERVDISQIRNREELVRVWVHESLRVYGDSLLSVKEEMNLHETMLEVATRRMGEVLDQHSLSEAFGSGLFSLEPDSLSSSLTTSSYSSSSSAGNSLSLSKGPPGEGISSSPSPSIPSILRIPSLSSSRKSVRVDAMASFLHPSGENYRFVSSVPHLRKVLEHAVSALFEGTSLSPSPSVPSPSSATSPSSSLPSSSSSVVLFDDLLRNVCSVARSLSSPHSRGLTLVGVGGSGKSTLVKLAAHLCDFKVTGVPLSSSPSLSLSSSSPSSSLSLSPSLLDFFRSVFDQCAISETKTVLYIQEEDTVDHSLLSFLNKLVCSPVASDVFTAEEKEERCSSVRHILRQKTSLTDSKSNCWKFYLKSVRENLKVRFSHSLTFSLSLFLTFSFSLSRSLFLSLLFSHYMLPFLSTHSSFSLRSLSHSSFLPPTDRIVLLPCERPHVDCCQAVSLSPLSSPSPCLQIMVESGTLLCGQILSDFSTK